MSNRKATIILLTVRLIKNIVEMSEYFPKQEPLEVKVTIELDLSNYAIKVDLKNVTDIDT